MKFSIIVATFNSEKTLKGTLESIKNQTYKNFEVLLMDGVSKDKTLEIASFYKDTFDIKIFSEKDSGLYDAMNKGIKVATGDIVHILNSDDIYASENVLESVYKAFREEESVDMVYGDIKYFKENTEKIERVWIAGEYKEKNLKNGWIIPHPSLFVKNSFYKKVDKVFNTDFKISADYEFILRLLKIYKIHPAYISETFVSMRTGGVSDGSISSRMKGWKEIRKSWTLNGMSVPRFLIIRRLCRKIFDFV